MPEIPLCFRCRMPIDREREEYIVTNKDKVKYENRWIYAHVACQREYVKEETEPLPPLDSVE